MEEIRLYDAARRCFMVSKHWSLRSQCCSRASPAHFHFDNAMGKDRENRPDVEK